MPVKSAKQFRLMEGVAHGSIKGPASPSKAVAEDFLNATPKNTKTRFAKDKFSKGLGRKKNVNSFDTYSI